MADYYNRSSNGYLSQRLPVEERPGAAGAAQLVAVAEAEVRRPRPLPARHGGRRRMPLDHRLALVSDLLQVTRVGEDTF